MVSKELIVVSVGNRLKSRFDDYDYSKVIMKSVDPEDKLRYSLNMIHGRKTSQNWENNCKVGNVLQVVMQDRNPLNVDQFKEFRNITKTRKNNEVTKENLNSSIISMELAKIRKSIEIIEDALNEEM